MIDVRGLDVVFGHGKQAFHAVRNVSFSVERGHSFGLVGESGSGKTTVLRALAGLLDRVARVSGEMRVARQTRLRDGAREFGRRVQRVVQDPFGSLHPRHTVDTILGEPARVHRLDRIS